MDGSQMFPTIEMREELPENLNQQENLSDQNQEGENQLLSL